MWRRSVWGNAAATVVLVFLCVFQFNFLSSAVFMNDAGIAGASAAIPQAAATIVLFAIPSGIMLWGVTGPSRGTRTEQEHQPF